MPYLLPNRDKLLSPMQQHIHAVPRCLNVLQGAQVSVKCAAFRNNTTEFELFCGEAIKSCQEQTKIYDATEMPHVSNNATTTCKHLWISGMSLGFPQRDKHNIANGGAGFQFEYASALNSFLAYGQDVLVPILFVLTPDDAVIPLSQDYLDYLAWVQQKGVRIHMVRNLTFQDLIYRHYPEYRLNGKIGYYLRLDMPKLVQDSHLFDIPGICNDTILWTDNDVFFTQRWKEDDMRKLTGLLDTPEKYLVYGQDLLINRPKPSNTGVMLMHVARFARQWPNVFAWGRQQKRFPEHDQLWLNRYFADPRKWRRENALLPPHFNWKMYWQLQDGNAIKMVHSHGPKLGQGVEGIAHCDVEGLSDLPVVYRPLVQLGMCCDQGKTANEISQAYLHEWKPDALEWKNLHLKSKS